MSLFNQTPFYHEHILRFFTAFGDIFSGITITKRAENGDKLKIYEVPIEYAPKNKWLRRIREQNDLTAPQVKMTLPRMSFEMIDIRYAPLRKVGVNGSYALGVVNGSRGKIFPPTPYDVIFNVYALTKDNNDSLQILEQIVPYFQPYLSLTYEILPEYQITKDIPITMQAYQVEDAFEGSPEDVRTVNQIFTFAAQMDFFGPMMTNSAIIKDVIVNVGYEYNKPTHTKIEVKVDPITANVDDVYAINSTITTEIL